jgi:hypothetical protein
MMVSAISDDQAQPRGQVGGIGATIEYRRLPLHLQRQSQFGLIPQYDIRGAVSQFDPDVERKDLVAGYRCSALFSLKPRAARCSNVLGFDAAIQTADLTLVNGDFEERHGRRARREGRRRLGHHSEGRHQLQHLVHPPVDQAQAVRNRSSWRRSGSRQAGQSALWKCLGVAPDNPEVTIEIELVLRSVTLAT